MAEKLWQQQRWQNKKVTGSSLFIKWSSSFIGISDNEQEILITLSEEDLKSWTYK